MPNRKLAATTGAALSLVLPAVRGAGLESEPVIVTATRTPQPLSDVLASSTVITRDRIEQRMPASFGDLLRWVPGLEVARPGGPGQPSSVFMRGTESNHVLLLIDGVEANPGTIGGAPFRDVRPELIERVEVVKGPRATLYGSKAIGGVINVITRRGGPGDSFGATIGGGSYATREVSATAAHGGDTLRAGVSASWYQTEGFPTFRASDIDRGERNASFDGYLGTRWRGLDIELTHWQTQGRTEYTDTVFDPVTFAFTGFTPLDEDFTDRVSALTLQANPTARWGTTLRLSQLVDDLDQNQSSDFAHTRRNVLEWQNDVAARHAAAHHCRRAPGARAHRCELRVRQLR